MNSKRHSRKTPSTGWTVVLILTLLTTGFVATQLIGNKTAAPSTPHSAIQNKEADEVDAEKIILAKLTQKQIDPRYSPILIYRTELDTNFGKLAGVGTLFNGPSGEQVLTVEHLLLKEYGTVHFAFRRLQPLSEFCEGGLSKVMHQGKAFVTNGNPDIAILKVGPLQKIECYAERPRFYARTNTSFSPVAGDFWLTSLVSGEKIRMVGVCHDPIDNVDYPIAEYDSVEGESGTPFEDASRALYALKGEFTVGKQMQEEFRNKVRTNKKLISLYGPLTLGHNP